jgi:protease I
MNTLICRRDFVKGSVAASAIVSASSAFGANGLARAVNGIDEPLARRAAGSFDGPLILPSGGEYSPATDPLAKEKPLLGKKVAVLVETEYIYDEIEYYRRRIPALGGEVTLLTHLWGKPSLDFVNDIDSPDRHITDVHRLTVTECVTKHDPSEFDIVICAANYVAVRLREVPPVGSLASPEQTSSAPAVQFFARAMENRKVLKAAMCHALWILTPRPDLLKGRRIICHTVVLADIHNAGAAYVPAENHVVIDNDLVTARSFADIEPYFDAIVATSSKFSARGLPQTAYVPPGERLVDSDAMKLVARQTAANMTRMTFVPERLPRVTIPTAEVSRLMADGKYNFAKLSADIQAKLDISGIKEPVGDSEILFVAADHGVWGSEMTLAMKAFVAAGYHTKVATLSGKAPMFLPVSMNEKFEDPTWGAGWVAPGEAELGWQMQKQLFEMEQKGEIVKLDDLIPHRPQAKDGIAAKQKYEKDLGTGLEKLANVRGVIVPGGTGSIIDLADNSQLEALRVDSVLAERVEGLECRDEFLVGLVRFLNLCAEGPLPAQERDP